MSGQGSHFRHSAAGFAFDHLDEVLPFYRFSGLSVDAEYYSRCWSHPDQLVVRAVAAAPVLAHSMRELGRVSEDHGGHDLSLLVSSDAVFSLLGLATAPTLRSPGKYAGAWQVPACVVLRQLYRFGWELRYSS
ncbi:hypothetical protein PHISP_03310 [Aspergillus sp. HF37]|nr:hypothetical protein PHISP_03310 [Aspergillus sp. HF37]